MPVPNTFANATTSIPLSQLDQNFATAITLGNTAIQLGNTVTTLNNMTLANVTVSSGNVTVTSLSGAFNGTVGATTPNTGAFTTLSASGMISSTVTSQFFDRQGASTAISYMRVRNTSGDMTFGIEGSAGGALASGTAAYSVVLADNSGAGLNLVSSTGKAVLTSTGLAVTGTVSSTGNALFQSGLEIQGSHASNRASQLAINNVSGATQLYAYGSTTGAANRGTYSIYGIDSAGANDLLYATFTSSGNLLVGTASSTAGYALKVGGANANILIQADSPNGATLLCDSSAAGSKGAFFGHITTVSQAQVRCGASGGVYLSDGATSWTAISDERQKTDLVPITDALVKVSSLSAVTGRYVWDEKRRAFLIAQEVQQVLPEAIDVADDADGTLGLAYTDVIPLLVASIKELNAKVAALESKNAQV